MNKTQDVIKAFSEATAKTAIHLHHTDAEAMINESKLFGRPYAPNGFQHPTDIQGRPMLLLAQINCADVTSFEQLYADQQLWDNGFIPHRGILQFYVSQDYPFFNINWNNLCDQSYFRVLYHESNILLYHRGEAADIHALPQIPLQASVVREPMSVQDYRFEEIFLPIYNRMTGQSFNGFFKLPEDEGVLYYDALSKWNHRIGGYPVFVQQDPRKAEQYRGHNFVLLQLVGCPDLDQVWMNDITITFLIREEDLIKRDFSNVLMNVDFS